jgi:hypothetical protein
MSVFQNRSLNDIENLIKGLYNSIEIRSLIVNEKNEWKNVFTIINFTKKNKKELKKEHEDILNKYDIIDEDDIKIKFLIYDIKEYKEIYEQVINKYLNIGDIKTYFTFENKLSNIGHISNYDFSGELKDFQLYGVEITDDKLGNIINYINDRVKHIGIYDYNQILNIWFNVKQNDNRKNIMFIFPIYIIVQNFIFKNSYEIQINMKIDNKLIKNSTITILRYQDLNNKKNPLDRKKIDINYNKNEIQDNIQFTEIHLKYEAIPLDNSFEILISNLKYGLLYNGSYYLHNYNAYNITLYDVFKQYNANNIIEKDIFENPINSKSFELSISWLLELLGLNTIYLEKLGEKIFDNNIERGSTDIIAFNSKSKYMYLIDCTITPPDAKKIDMIRNTAEYIAKKNNIQIRPVIFCGVNCPSVKKENNETVLIVDKEDIITLYQILTKDKYENEFQKIFGDGIPFEKERKKQFR